MVAMASYLTKASRRRVEKKKEKTGQSEVAAKFREEKGSEPKGEAKGTLHDIWSPYATTHGYWLRPSGLSYEHLRQIAKRVGIVAAIIWTRMNQCAAFAKIPEDELHDPGFRIRPRDKNQKVTKAAQAEIDYITDFVLHCGDRADGRMFTGDSFQSLMRKSVRDSLTYDQVNLQIHQRLNGKPYELIAMPAHTMRMASPSSLEERGVQPELYSQNRDVRMKPTDVDDVRYVQVYQSIPISDFTARELTFGIRNPRSDLDVNGYGFSEIEECIYSGDLTRLAQADAYNTLQFKQGAMTDGFLNYETGNINKKEMRNMARQWKAMVMGVENAFRLPILNAPGLKYTNLGRRTNRDMEFAQWYEQIIRRILAIFQIDGAELGLAYGNVGQTTALSQGGVTDKIKSSKDRGLRPILTMMAELLTRHVVMLLNPDFVLEFTGLNFESENDRIEKISKKVEKVMMVDEGRAELGMDPMPNGEGKVILNQVWLQSKQAADAQGQEGAEGVPGEGGPPIPGGPGGEAEPGAEGAPEEGGEDDDFMSLFGGGAGEEGEEEEPGEKAEKSMLAVDEWYRS
jgi:hypothetical protein